MTVTLDAFQYRTWAAWLHEYIDSSCDFVCHAYKSSIASENYSQCKKRRPSIDTCTWNVPLHVTLNVTHQKLLQSTSDMETAILVYNANRRQNWVKMLLGYGSELRFGHLDDFSNHRAHGDSQSSFLLWGAC